MAYLELKDVYFEYPSGHVAVEGVSISADLGEKIAIIGENGAGKTTTAKLMNGLLKPTKGEVLINGVSTKGKNDRDDCAKSGLRISKPRRPNF